MPREMLSVLHRGLRDADCGAEKDHVQGCGVVLTVPEGWSVVLPTWTFEDGLVASGLRCSAVVVYEA